MNKTKKMIVDFRKTKKKSNGISIVGEEVELMHSYKYLFVHLGNRLAWKRNTDAVYKEGQSRLYFIRKLRSFSVSSKILHIFYQYVEESAISAVICWGNTTRVSDFKKLNKMIKKAGPVLWDCSGASGADSTKEDTTL